MNHIKYTSNLIAEHMHDMPGIDHSNHVNHIQATSGGVDLLLLLALFFSAGVLFYLFRLLAATYVRKINGHSDAENEFWHGACLLAMVTMLAPSLSFIPAATVWIYLLPVGVVWYLVRACIYGKKIPDNKTWYDFAHAAMLFGMWWMFVEPLSHPLLSLAFTGYWIWFGGYYATRIWADFKKPHWLSFGQDIFHFVMAVVMALMVVFPATFMPGHNHGNSAPALDPVICSPSNNSPGNSQPNNDSNNNSASDHHHHH